MGLSRHRVRSNLTKISNFYLLLCRCVRLKTIRAVAIFICAGGIGGTACATLGTIGLAVEVTPFLLLLLPYQPLVLFCHLTWPGGDSLS